MFIRLRSCVFCQLLWWDSPFIHFRFFNGMDLPIGNKHSWLEVPHPEVYNHAERCVKAMDSPRKLSRIPKYYPLVIKHGDGKYTVVSVNSRITSPIHIGDFPLLCLTTRGYIQSWWLVHLFTSFSFFLYVYKEGNPKEMGILKKTGVKIPLKIVKIHHNCSTVLYANLNIGLLQYWCSFSNSKSMQIPFVRIMLIHFINVILIPSI